MCGSSFRPLRVRREWVMANPQPEPFVKFSKELFDAILLSPMPATHKELVLAVVRRTYGDHGQKQAPISVSLLVAMTGRDKAGVCRALHALRDEGVLRQVASPTFTTPAVYALNKDYERWGRWSTVNSTSRVNSTKSTQSTVRAESTGGVRAESTIEEQEQKTREEPPLNPPQTNGGGFTHFWQLYPRKVGKGAAEKAWKVAAKKAGPEVIIHGLTEQLPVFATKEREFIPHPATWLRQERWSDEDESPVATRMAFLRDALTTMGEIGTRAICTAEEWEGLNNGAS